MYAGGVAATSALQSGTGYVGDDDLATVLWLSLTTARPPLLEGESGTGKPAPAEAAAQARGDTGLLAGQMARLHRFAHRVVWVDPHRGKLGYAPVQAGMAAALPFVDDVLAGLSIASYADLLAVIADA